MQYTSGMRAIFQPKKSSRRGHQSAKAISHRNEQSQRPDKLRRQVATAECARPAIRGPAQNRRIPNTAGRRESVARNTRRPGGDIVAINHDDANAIEREFARERRAVDSRAKNENRVGHRSALIMPTIADEASRVDW